MRTYYFILMAMLLPAAACAQGNKTDADRDAMIAASQSGASPLFFDPAANDLKPIKPLKFDNAKECIQRNGLPNFFAKVKAKKPVTIGYIGGSITQSVHGYRASSARYIQSMFPKATMKAINAGVSGTGTDLGACRLQEQLLQFRPDLIFIEFAVNGAYRDGLEGMIRQIRQSDPTIEICLLYTLFNGQSAIYAAGKIPENIAGFEAIADHYKIPSIHMGMQAAMMEQEGELVWKSDSKSIPGKIVFSNDGIHPLTEGGDLYAGAIARSFETMQSKATVQKHELPKALMADNWEDARMYAPEAMASFSKGWEKIDPATEPRFKQFKPWFPYIMKATEPGASFTFRFTGNMFGLFDIGGPEAGQLSIEVDGKPVSLSAVKPGTRVSSVIEEGGSPLLNRFNNFCNNRYRGQFECIKVAPGEHIVTITISPEKPDKRAILGEKQLTDINANPDRYNQTNCWLGKILLNGKPR